MLIKDLINKNIPKRIINQIQKNKNPLIENTENQLRKIQKNLIQNNSHLTIFKKGKPNKIIGKKINYTKMTKMNINNNDKIIN